jgi:hypothetical protein
MCNILEDESISLLIRKQIVKNTIFIPNIKVINIPKHIQNEQLPENNMQKRVDNKNDTPTVYKTAHKPGNPKRDNFHSFPNLQRVHPSQTDPWIPPPERTDP